MGYCISVIDSSFAIKKGKKKKALKAIQALRGKEPITDSSGKHFSWVSNDRFNSAKTLEEMLKEWRWCPENNEEYDIIALEFTGEKLGDDELLFTAIGPYVEAGSYIEFEGEDHSRWRYEFNGKKMIERIGRVSVEWSMF